MHCRRFAWANGCITLDIDSTGSAFFSVNDSSVTMTREKQFLNISAQLAIARH
ncbi:MAG: hypothetical protein WBD47_03105 [Phormidesmis sp.]